MSVWTRGELCRRLWEIPEIRNRYQERMRQTLESVWNEKSILADLDRIHKLTEQYRQEDEASRAENATRIRARLAAAVSVLMLASLVISSVELRTVRPGVSLVKP